MNVHRYSIAEGNICNVHMYICRLLKRHGISTGNRPIWQKTVKMIS
jgi:hypothetical protein